MQELHLDSFYLHSAYQQGYKAAGFSLIRAVEKDCTAVETFTANNLNAPIYPGLVEDFIQMRGDGSKRRRPSSPKRVDVLHGSPPCQGFSKLNSSGGKNDLENNNLSYSILEEARISKPRVIVYENVLGLWDRKHQHYLKNIIVALLELGYQVRCCKLDACNYGDPQTRPRLFLFASRHNVPLPCVPPQTHGDPESGLLPHVTVEDALRGVSDQMPNFVHSAKTDASDVRLDAIRVAPSITGKSLRLGHPFLNRRITVREAAALQSLPHNYEIYGTLTQQFRQVGNCVPVMLATAVAQVVKQALTYEYENETADS